LGWKVFNGCIGLCLDAPGYIFGTDHGGIGMSISAPNEQIHGRKPGRRMSLHEARQVTWLRNRPKPLGELLDQGYLNTSRLEWAANKAYDQELREAARVLLEWKTQEGRRSAGFQKSPARDSDLPKPPTLVGISLENARSTPWPFGPLRGQAMGILSEARQLSLKDLAYAAESAWDDRVRQAAIALLLVRLDQELEEPPPSAGFLRVVAPERS
jgi:hypothetical protein